MKPTPVDFSRVEPHQIGIHDRLVNWTRWVTVKPTSFTNPMFAQFKTSRQWDISPHMPTPVDILDAMLIEKAVIALPRLYREALQWLYVHRTSVTAQRKRQGLTSDGLAKVVRDARQMLINRLVA